MKKFALVAAAVLLALAGWWWVSQPSAAEKNDQRAYLKIETGTPKHGDFSVYPVSITNIGKTAALSVTLYRLLNAPFHETLPLNASVYPLRSLDDLPGDRFSQKAARRIEPGETKTIDMPARKFIHHGGLADGQHGVFVVGIVFYEDKFDRTHRNTFCFLYAKANPDGPGKQCEKGNESD